MQRSESERTVRAIAGREEGMTILNGIGHVAGLRPTAPRDDFWDDAEAPVCATRTLARTPLASGINENITLNMQYLRSIAENRA